MKKKDAINFLKSHQPLPKDAELSEDLIQKYDEVREYFLEFPDQECIPLFLNSFGEGDGLGVYQLVEDVITLFPLEKVISHLKQALGSKSSNVRYWSAQIAANYTSEDLLNDLLNVYKRGDIDSKCAALTALSGISHEEVYRVAEQSLRNETNEVLLEIANDILTS